MDSGEETTRTIVVAVLANLLVALAKAVVAVLSGSAALMAETAHSVADTANELLLFVGLKRSVRVPDEEHPLGWGQERYFWALLAAVGIFVVGGLASVYEGVQSIREPEPLKSIIPGVVVLLVSACLEGWSWHTARTQLTDEASERRISRRTYLQVSSDPASTTVYLEDSAALVGLSLALAALVLHAVTGSAVWDGIASILIGVLLIVVALVLTRRNQQLLVNASAPPAVLERLRATVEAAAWVHAVHSLVAVWLGPRQLLVLADVEPGPDLSTAELVSAVGSLRETLMSLQLVGRVEITPVNRSVSGDSGSSG